MGQHAGGGADFDQIMDACKDQGLVVERTWQGHYKVRRKDGAGDVIHVAKSGDPHARLNIIRDLKRACGFVWPPPPKPRGGNGASAKDEPCCTKCFNIGGPCRNAACECHVHVPQLARLAALTGEKKQVRIDNGVTLTHDPSRDVQGHERVAEQWVPSKKVAPEVRRHAIPIATDIEGIAKQLVELRAEYQLHSEHETVLLQKLKDVEKEVASASAARAEAWAKLATVKRAFDDVVLGDLPPAPESKEP